MRLAKGIAAVACFLVGLWLMLRAAGLLTAVLSAVPRWWPALPAAAGAAILVRSRRPGPHTVVSLVLIASSGVAFAITRHLIAVSVWPFAVGAGLLAAGLVLAYLATRSSAVSGSDQRIVLAFRSAVLPTASARLTRIRVYAFCGRLDLDIIDCLPPGSRRRNPLMIDVVACLASVKVVAHPEVEIYHHKAFALRFGATDGKALRDEATGTAPAVVASMAFFGRVRVPSAVSPGA